MKKLCTIFMAAILIASLFIPSASAVSNNLISHRCEGGHHVETGGKISGGRQ